MDLLLSSESLSTVSGWLSAVATSVGVYGAPTFRTSFNAAGLSVTCSVHNWIRTMQMILIYWSQYTTSLSEFTNKCWVSNNFQGVCCNKCEDCNNNKCQSSIKYQLVIRLILPHNVFLVQTYGFVEWAMTGVELLIKLPYYDYLWRKIAVYMRGSHDSVVINATCQMTARV